MNTYHITTIFNANTTFGNVVDEEHNQYPWDKIRTQLLPSKEVQSLQFRYSQMTSMSSQSNGNNTLRDNKFMNYVSLKRKYLSDRYNVSASSGSATWSLFEDMQLLRGYQVHGSKWLLLNMSFLPHKSLKDIKSRWQQLLRQGTKIGDDASQTDTGACDRFISELKLNHPYDNRGRKLPNTNSDHDRRQDTHSSVVDLDVSDDPETKRRKTLPHKGRNPQLDVCHCSCIPISVLNVYCSLTLLLFHCNHLLKCVSTFM